MKPLLLLAFTAVAVAGCGGRLARLERMNRVETAVLTDASALSQEPGSGARPTVEINDPDRLAALETFLKQRRGTWRKVEGRPRPARFQLELRGEGEPIYTVWLDRGYLALAEGKEIQETRLSNDDAAELLGCLGLPPDYLTPPPTDPGPVPGHAPVPRPRPVGHPGPLGNADRRRAAFHSRTTHAGTIRYRLTPGEGEASAELHGPCASAEDERRATLHSLRGCFQKGG